MRTLFRVVLWNVGFAFAFVAVAFIFAVWVEYYFPGVGRSVANVIGLGLPGLLAVWILFLGSMYATSRGAVAACALGAGALVLVQCVLIGVLRELSAGFAGRTNLTNALEILLAAIVVIGVVLIWLFVGAKRSSRANRA